MGFVTRILHRAKLFLSSYFPLKNWVSEFLVNCKNVLMLACLGGFVILTSSRSIRIPHSEGNFPHSYTSHWVHKPTDQLKQIELDIDQKRVESIRSWRCYNEAERRISYGTHLLRLDRAVFVGSSMAKWIPRAGKTCQNGMLCFLLFCVLAAELANLDEREFRLIRGQKHGPG